jgi:4-diphosphocytidyl-2-C-methyl-D-erythritol kinase
MLLRSQAPAKINRELRVGGRRPDGYHAILSRFASIDLADELKVEPADGLSFSAEGEDTPADDSNLVVRSAQALAERLGIAAKARIHLLKRIPVGAGLGGGSSDAAATLTLLARLWNARLASDELADLAARLGSDVAFFLSGGQADVSGRGERVTPKEDVPTSEFFLFVPPFWLSTAKVYAAHDRLTQTSSSPLPQRLEIETSGRFLGPNDLAEAVLQTDSRMATYVRAAEAVASESTITGSGSAIVLTGISQEIRKLTVAHPEARLYACRTLNRDEYRRKTTPSGGGTWT